MHANTFCSDRRSSDAARSPMHCGARETLAHGYTSSGFFLGFSSFFFFCSTVEQREEYDERMWVRRWLVAWTRKGGGVGKKGGERMKPKKGRKEGGHRGFRLYYVHGYLFPVGWYRVLRISIQRISCPFLLETTGNSCDRVSS